MRPLVTPLYGVKAVDLCWPPAISSPYADTVWPPSPSRVYTARNGIYFWALDWRRIWRTLGPLTGVQAILLLEAVPAETPGVLLEPARECTGPQLPPEADAIVHRNLVAIARAVRVCGMLVPTDWAPAGITDHIYHLASDSVCSGEPGLYPGQDHAHLLCHHEARDHPLEGGASHLRLGPRADPVPADRRRAVRGAPLPARRARSRTNLVTALAIP
ncbi:MAG: hypothetical protein KatS3mg038_0316 [Candidatus Kapaibacterium sp.]|nr:MAG: hypothetical protein KatS3mg038_0316 [Candidatus Kapabacteria bacterium]